MILYLWGRISGYPELFSIIFTADFGNPETYANAIDLITSILVFIFGSGSLYSIIKLFYNYRSTQQIKLVSIFSETDKMKRLSGVQEISKYSRILFKELFFICSMEKDELIKEFVFDILEKQSPHSRKHCIILNNFLLDYCIKHNYRIIDLKGFQISNEMLEILINSPTDRRILLKLYQNKFSGIADRNNEINNHLLLSSQLLGSAIKKSFHFRLCGNLIAQSDMYASTWVYVSMQNCVFIDHISSHMFSFSTKYQDCFMKSGNYSNSKFLITAFKNCMIQNCIFNNSYFILSKFQKEENNEISNKSCDCKNQKKFIIDNSKWKDCKIIHSTYEKIQFQKNEMIRTYFFSISFTNVQFFKTNLIGGFRKNNPQKIKWVKFKECIFKNVIWGGALLKYVQFINCLFENATFVGTNLEKVVFTKCQFEYADFNKIKLNTETKFLNCRFKNLTWNGLKASDAEFTGCTFETEDRIENI